MTSPYPTPPFTGPSPSDSSFTIPSTSEPVFSMATTEPVFQAQTSSSSQPSQNPQHQFQQYNSTTVSSKIKARTILLQSLPEDHMADFHHLDDAKDIWLCTRLYSLQKVLSQLNQMQARPDNEDCNMKFLRALPPSWSQVAITLKTKGGLDFLSFDDLYNKLRTLEIDVKSVISAASTNSKWSTADSKGQPSMLTITTTSSLADAIIEWKKGDSKTRCVFLAAGNSSKAETEICHSLGFYPPQGFGDTFGSDEVFDLSAPSIFDTSPMDVVKKPLYDWFVKPVGLHAVPGPITGTFMPPSNKPDIDDTQDTYGSKSNNHFETNSVSNDFVSCDNSDKSSDSETTGFASCVSSVKSSSLKTKDQLASASSSVDLKTLHKTDDQGPCNVTQSPSFSFKENVKTPRNLCNRNGSNNISLCKNKSFGSKKCFVCGSKFHLIRDCDFYENQLRLNNAPVWKNVENIPSFVPRPAYVPAGSRNRPTSVPAGRPFPAGWHNPAARPMTRPKSHYFQQFSRPGSYNQMDMDGGRWGTADNPHTNKDIGIVDSGCSRSMTGNKEKLADFVKIKGGTVTFGGGDGKITGKGTIRTSNFNFENNKVLFTDSECLVLSKEFKLPDSSQVVLRVPRRHNLYCFNLAHIHPEREIKCLLAKASLDESTKWHRRMAHVNFKNMNKLANHGLVNGLPSKLFTNEHNCVACNKGKQHKASYKAITAVSTISEPLQLLHMDLFGPTSIRSIDHKYYSLVVTDDFSRFSWVFFLGTKDETFYLLRDFITFVENQLTKKVKGIRCDNGTEFKNSSLIELCGSKGIKRDYSVARTPQQNGVAERKNRTLIEAARTMLGDICLIVH
ncbi:putative ribonuclease H-like domain-containing protein [Tanacetum coccineum]